MPTAVGTMAENRNGEMQMLQGLTFLPKPLPPQFISIRRAVPFSSAPQRTVLLSPGTAVEGELSARERRQLRRERRERNAAITGSWREEVEERLAQRKKKEYSSLKEMLNLDNLAKLGPQWWMVRIARVYGHETAERLARALARVFPDMEFKVYFPTINEKKKLKNGSYSEKLKPLFPGCVFLHCVLNKEVHDYIKEFDGVGGFIGSKFAYKKRLINKPKPVSAEEMEKVIQKAEEQKQLHEEKFISLEGSTNTNSKQDKRQSRDDPGASNVNHLAPGATIRVLSGPFADYTGYLKDLDHTNKKATVGITLFGKESLVDLEVEQIAAETSCL